MLLPFCHLRTSKLWSLKTFCGKLNHWRMLLCMKINTASLVVSCIRCMNRQSACIHNRPTMSSFLAYFKTVSFILMVFTSGTSCFPFLSNLALPPQKKQLLLKENPSSDDQSTGLKLYTGLIDILGICSSWWVSFAI